MKTRQDTPQELRGLTVYSEAPSHLRSSSPNNAIVYEFINGFIQSLGQSPQELIVSGDAIIDALGGGP